MRCRANFLLGFAARSILILFVVASSGCSNSGTYVVHGTILTDGQPIATTEKRVRKVGLRPVESGSGSSTLSSSRPELFTATVADDGSFEISSVPPGNYLVLVSDFLRYPSHDQLAEFFRQNPKQFEVAVPMAADADLVIDIDSDWYATGNR